MSHLDILRGWLRIEEGTRPDPYDDATGETVRAPKGHVSIGVGHNLDAKPLSVAVIALILAEDMEDAEADAQAVVGAAFFELSPVRKAVVCDLAFQLGRGGLAGFVRMLAAIAAKNWDAAANEILDSRIAERRKQSLARAMRWDRA